MHTTVMSHLAFLRNSVSFSNLPWANIVETLLGVLSHINMGISCPSGNGPCDASAKYYTVRLLRLALISFIQWWW